VTEIARWVVWYGRTVLVVFLASLAGVGGFAAAGLLFGVLLVSYLLGRLEQTYAHDTRLKSKAKADQENEP
jgi:hypothetical protein